MNLGAVKLKTVFQSINWINLALLAANVLNQWAQLFPGEPIPEWVLQAQVIIGILMPSLGGITHRLAHGEAQAPDDRTVAEVASGAEAARATLIATAPAGATVAVPQVSEATATGTMPAAGAP